MATRIREDKLLKRQGDTIEALSLETRSILIVGDDRELLHALKAMLDSEGSIVKVAETVGTALELMSEYDFDVFLIDISLPDAKGIELLKQVHSASHDSVKIMLTRNFTKSH
ncbi:MAG: response regulator [Candidatus Thorarchaeota archaeon]